MPRNTLVMPIRIFLRVHLSVSGNNEAIAFSNLSTGGAERYHASAQCFHSFCPEIRPSSAHGPFPWCFGADLHAHSEDLEAFFLYLPFYPFYVSPNPLLQQPFFLTLFFGVIKMFRVHVGKFHMIDTISSPLKIRIIANYFIQFGHEQLLEFGLP